MKFLNSKIGGWLLLATGLVLALAAYRLTAPIGPTVAMMQKIEAGPPQSMPALGFTDGDGKALTLADFKGKLVVLDVWATWCGPCRKEFPRLDRLQGAMGGNDLVVLPLSVDIAGKEAVEKFYRDNGVKSLGVYLDPASDSVKSLHLRGLPTTLILDRQGQEVARVEGEAAWDGPEVKALLQRLMTQS